MKNWLLIFILFFIASCDKTKLKSEISSINVSSFAIYNEKTGLGIPLSASEENINLAFGKPQTVNRGTHRTKQTNLSEWLYHGAVIHIENGRMGNIKLRSPDFSFSFSGKAIKVGEDIGRLKPISPQSFLKKPKENIRIGLHYNGEPMESYLQFDFDELSVITSISLTE